MEIPERGEEGYLVMFSKDDLEELKCISDRPSLTANTYVNYDPYNTKDGFFIFNEYSYVNEQSTPISVEQLKQLMFIDSLEN